MKLMATLHMVVLGLLLLPSLSLASKITTSSHTALVNDSDFNNPAISKKARPIEKVIDGSGPVGEYVSVQMASGSNCQFDLNLNDWTRSETDPCSFALQIYYSATKAVQYFDSLGYQLPKPVKIIVQDESLSGAVASAGTDTIRFRAIKPPDISGWLAPIIDVVFHEMTHITQDLNSQKDLLVEGKLGISFIEGHANLLAYLQSGRTDLGVLNGSPGMQVLTDKRFGRTPPGRYDGAEPFTSALAELTQEMTRSVPTLSADEISKFAGKMYSESFFKMNAKSNYQDYFKEIRSALSTSPKPFDPPKLVSFLQKSLAKRGLDIDATLFDGQTAGFLIGNYSLDYLSTYLPLILQDPKTSTSVETQMGMRSDTTITWPMKGYIITLSDIQNVDPCLNEKLATLPPEQQQSPNAVNYAFMACFEAVASKPLFLPGLSITDRIMNFPSAGTIIEVEPYKTDGICQPQTSIAFAYIFDQKANKVAELSVPLKCR